MHRLALALVILVMTTYPATAFRESDAESATMEGMKALIAAVRTAQRFTEKGEGAKALKTMEAAYEAARKAELAAIGRLEPGAKAPSDDYHFAETMFSIADGARNGLAPMYRERNCLDKAVALRRESVAGAERLAIPEKRMAERLMKLYQRLPDETGDEKLKLGQRLIAYYSEKPHRHLWSVIRLLRGQAGVYLAMGDKDSAKRFFQRYVTEIDKVRHVESPDLNPTPDQQLRMFIGDLALRREFAEKSLAHDKDLKVGNRNLVLAYAYIARGRIAGEQGEFERQVEDYRTALELFGNDGDQHFTAAYPAMFLARALMRQNKREEAGKLAAKYGICLD